MKIGLGIRGLHGATVAVALCLIIAGAKPVLAQEEQTEILGRWMVEKKDAIVEIEDRGGKLAGKIVWAKDRDGIKGDERLDAKNPEPDLRSRKVLGSDILTGVPTTPKDGWFGRGRIYNPKTGKSYDVKLKLESPDRLRLRVGGKILGHTTRWTRVE